MLSDRRLVSLCPRRVEGCPSLPFATVENCPAPAVGDALVSSLDLPDDPQDGQRWHRR